MLFLDGEIVVKFPSVKAFAEHLGQQLEVVLLSEDLLSELVDLTVFLVGSSVHQLVVAKEVKVLQTFHDVVELT